MEWASASGRDVEEEPASRRDDGAASERVRGVSTVTASAPKRATQQRPTFIASSRISLVMCNGRVRSAWHTSTRWHAMSSTLVMASCV